MDIIKISNKIKERFKKHSGYDIEENTVLDNFTLAISDGLKDAYDEIEKNKNPHLYTGLRNNQEIDELGFLLNIPRRDNEDDKTYLYRLLNWQLHYQSSNYTAINDSLLNLKHASNAQYVPFTLGTGTGTVFIILEENNKENEKKAIEEARERLRNVKAPSSYIEYKIVEPVPVTINTTISAPESDINNIKNQIEINTKEYINNLQPGERLELIEIWRIGINTNRVKYFNIDDILINNTSMSSIDSLQTTYGKFILKEMNWIDTIGEDKDVEQI